MKGLIYLKKTKFLLSLLAMCIASLFISNGRPAYAKEEISLDDVYKVYKDVLTDKDYNAKTFGLKDINNDGIPELLVNNAYGIFTYKDNNYVWLWDSWVICEMYYSPTTNRILYHYEWKGDEDWAVYEIDMDKGEMSTIVYYSQSNGIYYKNYETETTKTEVEETIEKMVPDRELLTTPYDNTEENRAKYLPTTALSKEKLTVYAGGESIKLKVTGTDSTVIWSSSNSSIAKVTENGDVSGLKPGKCIIKAEVDGKTLECPVTVKEIGLNKTSLKLKVKDTYKLKLNGVSDGIKWSSSNKSVAKVSSEGKITAIKKGTATIKATVNGKTYSCKVTVK